MDANGTAGRDAASTPESRRSAAIPCANAAGAGRARRRFGALAASLLLLAAVWAAAAALPTFTPCGPDALAGRLLLPLVATGLALLMVGLMAFVRYIAREHPGLMDVPDREAFLGLPPDGRLKALAPIEEYLWGMLALTNALFAALVVMSHFGALRGISWASGAAPLVFAVAGLAWTACRVGAVRRGVAREVGRAETSQLVEARLPDVAAAEAAGPSADLTPGEPDEGPAAGERASDAAGRPASEGDAGAPDGRASDEAARGGSGAEDAGGASPG